MAGDDRAAGSLRGLIVDWGGVLTAPLDEAMTAWARHESVPIEAFRDVMASWLGPPADVADGPQRSVPDVPGGPASHAQPSAQQPAPAPAAQSSPVQPLQSSPAEPSAQPSAPPPPPPPQQSSPVHELERGTLSPEDFEIALAAALRQRGVEVVSTGLLARVLGGLADLEQDMVGLVRRARRHGIKTALLSNSWGEHYPEHQWAGAFDAVVISGRVGMRKPDREIFDHTADLLHLSPAECVMVDDLPRNVAAAVAAGMVGVLHRSYEETARELGILLDLPEN